MKAVILAAGKASRMHGRQKTLTKIKGKSILKHNIDKLLNIVDEFIFVIGHKGNEIKKEFGNSYKGKKISYVMQEEQLGTGHALYQAKNLIKNKFINFNGDDIYSLQDIKRCLEYDLAVLAATVDNPKKFGVIVEENGYLKDLIEKPKQFISNLISTGFYVLTPMIFDELKDIIQNDKKSYRGEFEIVDAVKQLALKKKFKVVRLKNYWLPNNDIRDVEKSEEFFKKHIN